MFVQNVSEGSQGQVLTRGMWKDRLWRNLAIGLATAWALISVIGCQRRTMAQETPGADVAVNQRVTVLPVGMLGQPNREVADALALLLENEGMHQMETSDLTIDAAAGAGIDDIADAVGRLAKEKLADSRYVIFAEFLGTQGSGLTEQRLVVVDGRGQIVLKDVQTAKDADFMRFKPREPMDCCALAVERLRPTFGLNAQTRAQAAPGPMAKRWKEKSGAPDEAELQTMKPRQEALAKSFTQSRVAVYPLRVGQRMDVEAGKQLAAELGQKLGCKAAFVETDWTVASAPTSNEQKVLWSFANAFRDEVRRSKPDADYVLAVDYLMGPPGKEAGAVHTVVCDKDGNLVIVDFQNSHHRDFQKIEPKSMEDCHKLAVLRIQSYLN